MITTPTQTCPQCGDASQPQESRQMKESSVFPGNVPYLRLTCRACRAWAEDEDSGAVKRYWQTGKASPYLSKGTAK